MRIIVALFLCLIMCQAAMGSPFISPDTVKEATGYRMTTLADDLTNPWGLAWLPDGTMLITERPGRVRHLAADGSTITKDVPGAPSVVAVGQGGLLDIALHPDFFNNKLVYFTLSSGTRQANRTTLAVARFDGQTFTDVRYPFSVSQAKSGGQHFGSRLVWLPDGNLLMSIGDGGNPPARIGKVLSRDLAQDGTSHLGKVLRLNDQGEPVGDPLFDDIATNPAVYSIGHRNIQGMAYDSIRDTVWASEHGARGGDELNQIKPGKNYGWPKATFSKEYLFGDISDFTSLPGMVDPVMVWMKAIAPSGLVVYTGDRFSAWKGDLLAGGLQAQSVRRILLDDDGTVTGEEIIPVGQRVRDVRQGPDGLIYILTDQSEGQLIRLEP